VLRRWRERVEGHFGGAWATIWRYQIDGVPRRATFSPVMNKRFPPETNVNLIFLDRGCLDKDTNSNEAMAVSRITQKRSNRFARARGGK
jgi:hypothetical protein